MAALTRPFGAAWAVLLAAMLLPWSGAALGHTTQLSAARLTLDGQQVRGRLELNGRDLEVALILSLLDAAGQVSPRSLEMAAPAVQGYLRERVQLVAGETPCEAAVEPPSASGDHVRAEMAWRCPAGAQGLRYQATLFLEIDPRARHMITVDGDAKRFGLLSAGSETLQLLAVPQSPWRVAGRYVLAGIEHIAIGFDHIAFLVATVVWGRRFWPLAKVITAFTIAHSITLSLAALNVFSPPASLVEPLIAASIVYVAVENWFVRDLRRRWMLTFVFGLVHGFGFAGVLRDYGLPEEALVPALAAFNVGVEIGQLAIVSAVLALLLGVDRWQRRHGVQSLPDPRVALSISAAVGALGVWWLVERVAL
ncbi:MAG: HupE/UreJ family protein [Betaproteobacteria bacterium]|jgi:hydrogenase/urease accessory protein HupE|nr:HupE/UreJ family protein [Rhodocyclaceae bacterium]MCA3133427.1 HupE/UreJ family protein [Rhodocyclaceae bacterium]MCA3143230.1 HupE/UreJ family protein [Rhodocyclaceae bacterium]MCA3144640.1 HupE/UreJ family protein [Rhodocyclaceae bacterium]MCE2896405.1 HupE/UreJ family protein [Betaproteobacteria bacterium]